MSSIDDLTAALLVACPHCGAARGEWCRTPMGQPYRMSKRSNAPALHLPRVTVYRRTVSGAEC